MRKFFLIIAICLFLPWPVFAEGLFLAEVEAVLSEQRATRENGTEYLQQNVRLRGLEGEMEDKEIYYYGIGEMEVVGAISVSVGDKVRVSALNREDGSVEYYIIEHLRTGALFWLAVIFALVVVILGKKRGLAALFSLALSFAVIMWFILPQILAGRNPLLVSIGGSLVVLAAVIYLTWGWCRKAHLAFFSLMISLSFTGLLAFLTVGWTRLTGTAGEEILALVQSGSTVVNFQGLLLAGIIIGALGVLDDVVISQVSTVEQLFATDAGLSGKDAYRRAMAVGVDHISSMVNTLFLAYAGAALPLLLLFSLKQEPFLFFSQVINNEAVAAEIVRTLVGSLGLIMAVPLATFLAVKYLKKN